MKLFGFLKKKQAPEAKKEEIVNNNEIKPKPKTMDKPTILMGVVGASSLNIRKAPAKDAEILSVLKDSDPVNITAVAGEWYEVAYKGNPGYVMAQYIKLFQAKITASSLNIRQAPEENGEILAKLNQNEVVNVYEKLDGWIKFQYKEGFGYISSKYVQLLNEPKLPIVYFNKRDDLKKIPISADKKLPEAGSGQQKLVATIYNKYGGLLSALSKDMGIDVASAIAVLCVESGGSGFGTSGKLLIRFENHMFYNWWGKNNKETFAKYFSYSSAAGWKDHKFRTDEDADWKILHERPATQETEWEVLQFARSLDDTAALYSISMGAPQVMGSNFRMIGYDSVQDMFANFNKDMFYHICALFDFCRTADLVKHMKSKDFVSFARGYNGPGQPQHYGSLIKAYHDAFVSIAK
jgi:SH3-like domain-containing protein